MGGIFHPDGKFAHYGGKLADLMWLNVLVILCCLPLVTAGAAVTAMHYVLLKIYRDEEGKITKTFLRSFRENFRQSTMLMLIFGALLYLFSVSILVTFSSNSEQLSIARYILPAVAAAVVCVFNWALILQARYRNTVWGTMKLALAVFLAHPIRSVVMIVLAVLPGAMLYMAMENLILVVMVGVSIPGLLQVITYDGIFKRLETIANETPSPTHDN